ncbi:transcription initiation factor TFIID subunit 4-like isoform X1 [Syngnathus typhle]|uniref:transcription initiation factor TFIID subunit 4-like isoform X1 n=1 Tax=Syngnathus typhle TaxID=161592 RepID=UPI002A6A8EAB|nr:transcription initiation factor TFIID subunit 4-like isoform X1 [Syngnathus typhle]
MAGATDPLEDMLFNEVDEKAVSDLVGSLESQLGESEPHPASYATDRHDGAPAAATHISGKVPEQEPQQGHPGAALKLQPAAAHLLSSSSSTSVEGSAGPAVGGAGPHSFGPVASSSPAPVTAVQTLSAQPAASFQWAPEGSGRTASPSTMSLNGTAGVVKLLNSAAATAASPTTVTTTSPLAVMASPANFLPGTQSASPAAPTAPSAAQHRLPSAAQNGLESKGGPVGPSGAPSPSQLVNHSKMLVPGQPASGNILAGTPPPPAAARSPVTQPLGPPAVKPVVNGLGQPAVRAAGAVQLQRPGLVTGTVGPASGTIRPAAAHPPLAVRPQQQATIQLPPGFTMPAGMVLVRIETGQLVMVPQQVLAQAQAKTQQSPSVTAVPQRPAAPATMRVSSTAPAPTAPQNIRLATPPQTRLLQSPSSSSSSSSVQAVTVTSVAPGVSVKMAPPLKAQTPMATATEATTVAPAATGAAVKSAAAAPVSGAAVPGSCNRVTVVSQEMQENVKKCKNFLATLIKLASNNSPSPDTSKNVKALVQDLLDAKIEPEEFTSRLQAELKSSPQPYLIPFLKKSLPALRQSLLSSQQSLSSHPASAYAPSPNAAIRPRLPISTPGVRMNAPLATVAPCRGGMQTVRAPLVVGVRTPSTLTRAPTAMVAKSVVTLAAPANQKKLGDPGGGTFSGCISWYFCRDDDDINDVASMAGVNLSEENARILATSSELVGTKIRSCKDEAFLPAGLLHRRISDTARRLGVSEVPLEVVNLVSHATQSRLRSLLEKVSALAQHRSDVVKDEEHHEQTGDVRAQLRFFEQLERLEKQRKDEQEREILLKAAKSRARQEDPEQARLKQKAKEMQQQELAQMRQRDANLTALAAIGPRKKRKLDSPGATASSAEVASGASSASTALSSPRQPWRQRITRVNLRDLIVCLEQDGSTARSLMLYKALLK